MLGHRRTVADWRTGLWWPRPRSALLAGPRRLTAVVAGRDPLAGSDDLDRRGERLLGLAGDVGRDARAFPVGSGHGVLHAGLWQQRAHMGAHAHGGDVVGGAWRPLSDESCSSLALEVVGERFSRRVRALAD